MTFASTACVNFRLPTAGTLYRWEFEKAKHRVEVGVEGPLISGDVDIVTDAALSGVGLAYLFEDQVGSLLKAGALTGVFEDCVRHFRILPVLPGSAPSLACTRGVHRCHPCAAQEKDAALIVNASADEPRRFGRDLAVAVMRDCDVGIGD